MIHRDKCFWLYKQVLELMQMHPKERLSRVILTVSWFNDINVGYWFYQYCLSHLLWQCYIHFHGKSGYNYQNRCVNATGCTCWMQWGKREIYALVNHASLVYMMFFTCSLRSHSLFWSLIIAYNRILMTFEFRHLCSECITAAGVKTHERVMLIREIYIWSTFFKKCLLLN